MNYTKGEWHLLREGIEIHSHPDEAQHLIHTNIDGIPVEICSLPIEMFSSVSNPGGTDPEYHTTKQQSIANGRLIAAAPKMLDALTEIIAAYRGIPEPELPPMRLGVAIIAASKLVKKLK